MIHQLRVGFLVAGTIVFGTTYLFQFIGALGVSLSGTDGCTYCNKQAQLLLIPIAGPWLGDRADPQHGSLTPELIYGGIEAAGLAMLIVGFVGRDVPQEPSPQGRNVAILPFLTPQAEGVSMLMRW
jgi:hypothetical protein